MSKVEKKNTRKLLFLINDTGTVRNPNQWKLDPDSYLMPQLDQGGL